MAMRQTPAFGALLKRYRQAAGLTQEALADKIARPVVIKPTLDAFEALVGSPSPSPESAELVGAGA